MTLIGFFDVISPTQAQLCKPDMVDEIHPHLQQQGYDQGDQRYERTKLPLCQGQPSSNEHRCRGGGQSPRASGQFPNSPADRGDFVGCNYSMPPPRTYIRSSRLKS